MRSTTASPCPPILPAALSFVGDRQTFPPLGAAALENDATILGRHADTKTVRLGAAAFIRLESALALHDLLICVSGTFNTSRAVSKVSTRGSIQETCYSRGSCVPGAFAPALRLHSVCSPRFPQLWKTLWKSGAPADSACPSTRIVACFCRTAMKAGNFCRLDRVATVIPPADSSLLFRVIRHGRQHLGPNPHPDRNQG